MRKRVSTVLLWLACFALLSISGLFWGCTALKQKFSKKEKLTVSLSQQEILKDQWATMEHKEREWMKYFGESAVLMLNDGFRFHQDSGLLGGSAVLRYRSQAIVTERQKDSVSTGSLSEKHLIEDVRVNTEEVEKRKSKTISPWWLLVLVPVFLFIGRRDG